MTMPNNPAAAARAAYDRLVFQRGPSAVATEAIIIAFARATEAVATRAKELQAMSEAAAARANAEGTTS
jgi:hypothetical protein